MLDPKNIDCKEVLDMLDPSTTRDLKNCIVKAIVKKEIPSATLLNLILCSFSLQAETLKQLKALQKAHVTVTELLLNQEQKDELNK